MRILFLDQFSELGGAQHCLLDLIPEIEARGWTASAALPGNGPLVDLLRARNVQIHPIPCGPYRSGSKSTSDALRFATDLRGQWNMMRALKCDLLYVNGPRLLAAAAIAFGRRSPVLFHAHSPIPAGYSTRVARWSLRRSGAMVVACSQSVVPDVSSDKIRVIPNGTTDLGFRHRTFENMRIGIIGRIAPEKGQDTFVRAARLVAVEFPDARFVICGAPIFGAEKYFEDVRKLAEGLPVSFLGWREDIAEVLREIDLLVIPSKAEGLPRVLLEAFSAGVPVIAFPVGGIPEVICDGETGFLVKESTAEALASRIREVVRNPTALREVASNARRAWEQSYTVEIYRKSVTDLMARLVSDWRAEHGTESRR
jgi:glycosyltransferase involved in cell wall biosynthesis